MEKGLIWKAVAGLGGTVSFLEIPHPARHVQNKITIIKATEINPVHAVRTTSA